uniref:Ulp1 protease family, C-terminal catalytic domain-containing protein n=1 Tax=Parastrongyloides trichosuri TaxID=131310 RepID=A0A0N5A708_PARTI
MFIFGEYQDCWDKNDFDLPSTNELEVTTKSVTGDCSTVVDVVLRDINGVSMFWPTIFVSDEFNSMPKNGIAMYKILCKRFYDNIISQKGITKVKKCAMIKSTCLDFFTTYGYMERVIRALPLDNWGNIGQFLSCNFNE